MVIYEVVFHYNVWWILLPNWNFYNKIIWLCVKNAVYPLNMHMFPLFFYYVISLSGFMYMNWNISANSMI